MLVATVSVLVVILSGAPHILRVPLVLGRVTALLLVRHGLLMRPVMVRWAAVMLLLLGRGGRPSGLAPSTVFLLRVFELLVQVADRVDALLCFFLLLELE